MLDFDPKIGFLAKNCIFSPLDMSRIRKFDPNIFLYDFFYNWVMGLRPLTAKNKKRRRNTDDKRSFSRWFFLIFAPWTLEYCNFDRKFNIYAENQGRSRILRSEIKNLGQKMGKHIFQPVFS